MLTTSHILMGAALSTRPKMKSWMITLGWLGGFTPDVSMFAMVGLSRIGALGNAGLWRHPDGLYWNDPWLSITDYLNSIPIWGAICLLGIVLWRMSSSRVSTFGLAIVVFTSAGILHLFADLLTHVEDAHAHFLPISDWRFHSPVSYYRRDHFGAEFQIFETILSASLAIYLIIRFRQWPVRILAGLFGFLMVVLLAARPAIHMFF